MRRTVSKQGPDSSDCFEHSTSRRDGLRDHHTGNLGLHAEPQYVRGGRLLRRGGALRRRAGPSAWWWASATASSATAEPDLPFPSAVVAIGRFAHTDRRQWLALASIMHVPTGLFISGAYVNDDFRGINANERFGAWRRRPSRRTFRWWVDAAIQKNWTGWGSTTFYGEWGRFDDRHGRAAGGHGVSGPRAGGASVFLAGSVVLDSDVTCGRRCGAAPFDAAANSNLYRGLPALRGRRDDQWPGRRPSPRRPNGIGLSRRGRVSSSRHRAGADSPRRSHCSPPSRSESVKIALFPRGEKDAWMP